MLRGLMGPATMVAFVFVACGCGAPRPAPVEPPASTALDIASPDEARDGQAQAPKAAHVVVLGVGQSTQFQTLQVLVTDITEKRMMDGDSEMRLTLELRSGAATETIEIFSSARDVVWNGFKIRYQGGWREDAELHIDAVEASSHERAH